MGKTIDAFLSKVNEILNRDDISNVKKWRILRKRKNRLKPYDEVIGDEKAEDLVLQYIYECYVDEDLCENDPYCGIRWQEKALIKQNEFREKLRKYKSRHS